MLIIDLLIRKEEILEIFRKRIRGILEIREEDTFEDMITDLYSEGLMTTTMMTDGTIAEIISETILMKEIEGLMIEEMMIITMIEIEDLLQEDINTIETVATDFLFHLNTEQSVR